MHRGVFIQDFQDSGADMNEAKYRKELVRLLAERGCEVQAHEEMHFNYVPDVSIAANGRDGWIELKYLQAAPKTLGHIDHYTKGQEQWLIKRGEAGCGSCFLVVGTPDIHVIWRWDSLKKIRNIPWGAAVARGVPTGSIEELARWVSSVV
jgi:hypothetical protein